MKMAPKDNAHLCQIGTNFYFRRKVPLHLVEAMDGQKEIKISLRTPDRKEANRRILATAIDVQRRFDEAEGKCKPSPPANLIQKTADSVSFEHLELCAREWYFDKLSKLPDPFELASETEDRAKAILEAEMDLSDSLIAPDQMRSGLSAEAGKIFETLEVSVDWPQRTKIGNIQIFASSATPVWNSQDAKPRALVELLYRAKLELERQKVARLRGDFSGKCQDDLFSQTSWSKPVQTPALTNATRSLIASTDKDKRPLKFAIEARSAYISQRMKPRQASQYLSDLDELATSIKTVGDMEQSNLQKFIEIKLVRLKPNTIVRKFSVYRNYWSYLKANQLVSKERQPFEDLLLPKKRVTTKRTGWPKDEVCRLWHEAKKKKFYQLADAIRIAAFTGSRIEAICSLTSKDVIRTRDQFFVSFSDKTLAGQRAVPVHSAIKGLVERLMKEAPSRNGFLLPTTANNRHGERSTAIGKQFGRLKTDLGYDKTFVFHSLRHTVVQILADAGCPAHITADLVGHDKPFSYTVYANAVSYDAKLPWVETIAYPDTDFMKSQ
jgi:integrase